MFSAGFCPFHHAKKTARCPLGRFSGFTPSVPAVGMFMVVCRQVYCNRDCGQRREPHAPCGSRIFLLESPDGTPSAGLAENKRKNPSLGYRLKGASQFEKAPELAFSGAELIPLQEGQISGGAGAGRRREFGHHISLPWKLPGRQTPRKEISCMFTYAELSGTRDAYRDIGPSDSPRSGRIWPRLLMS